MRGSFPLDFWKVLKKPRILVKPPARRGSPPGWRVQIAAGLLRATCSWVFSLLPSPRSRPRGPRLGRVHWTLQKIPGAPQKTKHEIALLLLVPILSFSHRQGHQLGAVPMGLYPLPAPAASLPTNGVLAQSLSQGTGARLKGCPSSLYSFYDYHLFTIILVSPVSPLLNLSQK